MEPFELLPNEKIEEICGKLDPQSLGRMMRTNWRINQVCSKVLKQRRTEFLINKLIGKDGKKSWLGCISGVFLLTIDIEDSKNDISISYEWKVDFEIVENMKMMETSEETIISKSISKDDLKQLEELYANLIKYNFKPIKWEEEIWISKESGNRFIVYNYSKEPMDFKWLSYKDLMKIGRRLGMSPSGNDRADWLQAMIIQQADLKGKLVTC